MFYNYYDSYFNWSISVKAPVGLKSLNGQKGSEEQVKTFPGKLLENVLGKLLRKDINTIIMA